MNNNYDFFVNNLMDLVKDYDGKFIVIKEQRVIASYDSFDDAYVETTKTEILGNFIIQHCISSALEPSAHFAWTNVTFSSVTV
jgi:hypothetical protein